MIKFEVGKTYYNRFITDSDAYIYMRVIKRTPKTITAMVEGEKKPKVYRPFEYEGKEWIYPLGNYSMCPMLRADQFINTNKLN